MSCVAASVACASPSTSSAHSSRPASAMFARHACALRGIVLERRQPTSEHARAGREPDRRVAARAADLEHLDARLAGGECEQEAAGRRLDLARPLRRRKPGRALRGVLRLESSENAEHALVDHASGTSHHDHPVLADGDRIRRDRRERGQRHRDPALEIEPRAVPRADDDARLGLPVALAERSVVVRAAILDRVEAVPRSCRRRS